MIAGRRIWATTKVVGFHRWADQAAPAHLAVRHRHLFGVRATVTVDHDDRDVEFHALQGCIVEALSLFDRSDYGREFDGRSCEMIATAVGEAVVARWPGRPVAIEVTEDDECGAEVTWAPELT